MRARSPARGLIDLLARLLAFVTLSTPIAAADDPISLADALAGLGAHPRLEASPDLSLALPRRESLYLDCHRLAFSQLEPADSPRDRPLEVFLTPLAQQQLEVMRRFFDVLLADLSFASESEAMAVAYIQYDRAAVRSELGQYSELRVLELEAVYQEILQRRAASEVTQQLARALLAEALGQPEELPRDLDSPGLPALPDALPDLDDLLREALRSEPIRALGDGRSDADRRLIEMELRQQLLELLLRLRLLDAVETRLTTESAWRDLKLDESRALYEQEVTADLGYSMSQQTRTGLQWRRLGLCRALAWGELQALLGKPVWAPVMEEP